MPNVWLVVSGVMMGAIAGAALSMIGRHARAKDGPPLVVWEKGPPALERDAAADDPLIYHSYGRAARAVDRWPHRITNRRGLVHCLARLCEEDRERRRLASAEPDPEDAPELTTCFTRTEA